MTKLKSKKIIIEGVTHAGVVFRPADWAERMSGSLSTFKKQRIHYSPLLQPMTKNGHKCIMLDSALKKTNPTLYDSILEFARINDLKICQDAEEETGT